MSVDLIARGLATQASSNATTAGQRAGSIDLFANLASRTIDGTITAINSGGYASSGAGAAGYIADALASAALASACPHFCAGTANGRYFRAAPVNGLVPVHAGGCIGFDAATYTSNHQPLMQEALDYCVAVGAKGILLADRHYALWRPARANTSDIYLDKSGIPLVVRGPLRVVSAIGGSYLWRRDGASGLAAGGDPNAVGAWQNFGSIGPSNTQYWRGGMFLVGNNITVAPADLATLPALTLQDIHLRGGLTYDGGVGLVGTGPRPSDGAGWDITDKAIWCENNRYFGDLNILGDCSIDGFGGEFIYMPGANGGAIYQRGRLKMSNGNGDGLNPGGNTTRFNVDVEWIEVENVLQAFEGWLGRRGKLRGIFRNCARAGNVGGGGFGAGTYSAYNNPTRISATEEPLGTLDLLIVNCLAPFRPGAWLRGRLTLIDTQMVVGDNGVFADGLHSTDFELVQMISDQSTRGGIVFAGVVPAQAVKNFRIRQLVFDRTEYALANSIQVGNALGFYGSLGKDIKIDAVSGFSNSAICYSAAFTDYTPVIRNHDLSFNGAGVCNVNAQTSSTIPWNGPVMYLTSTTPTVAAGFAITMASVNMQFGQEVRLQNTTSAVTFRLGTTNTRRKAAMTIRPGCSVLLRYDGAFWMPVEGGAEPMVYSQTISFGVSGAAIPAGGTSDEVTISAPAVALGDAVDVGVTGGSPPAKCSVQSRVTAGNIIVWMKNDGAASVTPGALNVYGNASPSV